MGGSDKLRLGFQATINHSFLILFYYHKLAAGNSVFMIKISFNLDYRSIVLLCSRMVGPLRRAELREVAAVERRLGSAVG